MRVRLIGRTKNNPARKPTPQPQTQRTAQISASIAGLQQRAQAALLQQQLAMQNGLAFMLGGAQAPQAAGVWPPGVQPVPGVVAGNPRWAQANRGGNQRIAQKGPNPPLPDQPPADGPEGVTDEREMLTAQAIAMAREYQNALHDPEGSGTSGLNLENSLLGHKAAQIAAQNGNPEVLEEWIRRFQEPQDVTG